MNGTNNIIISLSSDGASIKAVTGELHPEVDITNQQGIEKFVYNYIKQDNNNFWKSEESITGDYWYHKKINDDTNNDLLIKLRDNVFLNLSHNKNNIFSVLNDFKNNHMSFSFDNTSYTSIYVDGNDITIDASSRHYGLQTIKILKDGNIKYKQVILDKTDGQIKNKYFQTKNGNINMFYPTLQTYLSNLKQNKSFQALVGIGDDYTCLWNSNCCKSNDVVTDDQNKTYNLNDINRYLEERQDIGM